MTAAFLDVLANRALGFFGRAGQCSMKVIIVDGDRDGLHAPESRLDEAAFIATSITALRTIFITDVNLYTRQFFSKALEVFFHNGFSVGNEILIAVDILVGIDFDLHNSIVVCGAV